MILETTRGDFNNLESDSNSINQIRSGSLPILQGHTLNFFQIHSWKYKGMHAGIPFTKTVGGSKSEQSFTPAADPQPLKQLCDCCSVRLSCPPPSLLFPSLGQDQARSHLQRYFVKPALWKTPGFKLLRDQRTNTSVIISYSPVNASFVRVRQRYTSLVTAGPLNTHQMILRPSPCGKTSSALHTENQYDQNLWLVKK